MDYILHFFFLIQSLDWYILKKKTKLQRKNINKNISQYSLQLFYLFFIENLYAGIVKIISFLLSKRKINAFSFMFIITINRNWNYFLWFSLLLLLFCRYCIHPFLFDCFSTSWLVNNAAKVQIIKCIKRVWFLWSKHSCWYQMYNICAWDITDISKVTILQV